VHGPIKDRIVEGSITEIGVPLVELARDES
jgi:hypothetical protein